MLGPMAEDGAGNRNTAERRDLAGAEPVVHGPNIHPDRESQRFLYDGVAHQSADRPVEAAASYRRALDLDAGNTAAANGLALLLAWYGTGPTHLDEALRLAEQAVTTASTTQSRAMAVNTLGEVRFRRGELQRAIDDSEACIRLLGAAAPAPTRANALRRIGAACEYLGRTDRAVRALHEAVAANPADVNCRTTLARVANRNGDRVTAIAQYTHAIALVEGQPQQFVQPRVLLATLLNDRGCTYSGAGDQSRADEDFEHALRSDPTHAYAHINRAFQAGWRGERALMRQHLDTGLSMADTDDIHLMNALLTEAAAGAHRDLILDVLLDRSRIARSWYERMRSGPHGQSRPAARPATIDDPASEVPAGEARLSRRDGMAAAATGSVPRVRIVVFAANPLSSGRLAIDHEIREITEKLRASRYRDAFDMVPCLATRADDLLQYLNEYTPHIVHFCGHGSRAGEIVVAADRSGEHLVGAAALGALFHTMKDNIQIVVLNACFSAIQARAISQHVDYVVGMRVSIRDDAAAVFAAAFYRALGFNRTVVEAFDQATTALKLVNIPEDDVPELLVRPGAQPRLRIGR
jgi:tetratricopeptide (TPR) repeat protein